MKKLLALGLACCLPAGLAAENLGDASALALGTVSVLVIEDSAPLGKECAPSRAQAPEKPDCMAVHRALLTARIQKVSALHERGRWM